MIPVLVKWFLLLAMSCILITSGCGDFHDHAANSANSPLDRITPGGPPSLQDYPGSIGHVARQNSESSRDPSQSDDTIQLALEAELDIISYNDLEWIIFQEGTYWLEAREWISSLPGSGWRFPTYSELCNLYNSGITSYHWGPYAGCKHTIWTDETRVSTRDEAKSFNFMNGSSSWSYAGNSAFGVLAVR